MKAIIFFIACCNMLQHTIIYFDESEELIRATQNYDIVVCCAIMYIFKLYEEKMSWLIFFAHYKEVTQKGTNPNYCRSVIRYFLDAYFGPGYPFRAILEDELITRNLDIQIHKTMDSFYSKYTTYFYRPECFQLIIMEFVTDMNTTSSQKKQFITTFCKRRKEIGLEDYKHDNEGCKSFEKHIYKPFEDTKLPASTEASSCTKCEFEIFSFKKFDSAFLAKAIDKISEGILLKSKSKSIKITKAEKTEALNKANPPISPVYGLGDIRLLTISIDLNPLVFRFVDTIVEHLKENEIINQNFLDVEQKKIRKFAHEIIRSVYNKLSESAKEKFVYLLQAKLLQIIFYKTCEEEDIAFCCAYTTYVLDPVYADMICESIKSLILDIVKVTNDAFMKPAVSEECRDIRPFKHLYLHFVRHTYMF